MQRLVRQMRLGSKWMEKRALVKRLKSQEPLLILLQLLKRTATKHVATRPFEHGAAHVFEGVAEALGISVGRLQKTRSR